MKPKIVKTLQFFLFLLVGLILLYFAFRGIDLSDMLLQIRDADYRWVAFSALFCILALVFRTFRWRMLIEPLGEKPKNINIFNAINIGYLANFAFPRIGEIARCGALNRTDGIPVDKLFGTVVAERIFDLLMAFLMLCMILVLRFAEVSSFIISHLIQPVRDRADGLGILLIAAAIIVLICFVMYKIFVKKMLFVKIKKILDGVVQGVKTVVRLKNIKLFVALNFIVFGMYFLQTYVMFFAIESSSSLGLVDALFVLVLSSLAIIIPVQGGIGAYHWIISMGLIVLGLTREDGMVYATISHSATSIVLILLGAVSMIFVMCRRAHG